MSQQFSLRSSGGITFVRSASSQQTVDFIDENYRRLMSFGHGKQGPNGLFRLAVVHARNRSGANVEKRRFTLARDTFSEHGFASACKKAKKQA